MNYDFYCPTYFRTALLPCKNATVEYEKRYFHLIEIKIWCSVLAISVIYPKIMLLHEIDYNYCLHYLQICVDISHLLLARAPFTLFSLCSCCRKNYVLNKFSYLKANS